MKVSLHPAAENDLIEAASFYELEGSAALATRFIATFKRVATLLAEQPNIGLPRTRGRRSFPMHAFPYSVIYRAGGHEMRILVIKHNSRRPGFGDNRS